MKSTSYSVLSLDSNSKPKTQFKFVLGISNPQHGILICILLVLFLVIHYTFFIIPSLSVNTIVDSTAGNFKIFGGAQPQPHLSLKHGGYKLQDVLNASEEMAATTKTRKLNFSLETRRIIEEKFPAKLEIKDVKMACHLPRLDPFDPSIAQYIKPAEPVNCSDNPNFPLLFTTDLRSTLIQVNDPSSYGFFNCCWNSFQRQNGSEYDVKLSEKYVAITEKETLIPEDVEFIEISCDFVNTSVAVGEPLNLNITRKVVDIFGFMHLKPSIEKKIADDMEMNKLLRGSPQRNLNVVIFGLDAVSHMNFIRNFPLTFKYVTKNLSAMGISGLTKVADNTFPNLIPALTGLYVDELRTETDCRKTGDEPLDECPFIWKEFSRQGFRTASGEDAVWMGVFNYGNKGFSKQPTDYYIKNMAYQQSKKIGHHNEGRNAKICYGSKFSFQVLLDFLKQMAILMNPNRRYFQFMWDGAITHDYLMDGSLVDIYLEETLKFFHNQGFLENTAFILMSDHGIRWGGILDTLQGKIEERMPFAYFVLPEWFKQKYPKAIENLKSNEYKLSPPFDFHQTLLDFLFIDNISSEVLAWRQSILYSKFLANSKNLNLIPKNVSLNLNYLNSNLNSTLNSTFPQNSNLPRGISLFLEIPPERTCADATIADQWCVCKSIQTLDIKNNSLVDEAARNVVHFINGLLLKLPQCAELYFVETLNAQLQLDENVFEIWKGINNATDPRLEKKKLVMNLSLKVAPSNATFEATATRQISGEWEVSQEIGRTNAFGKQGWCIAPSKLEKYCFCNEAYDVRKDVGVVHK